MAEVPHLPEEAICSWEYWESQKRPEWLKSTKDIHHHHPHHLGEVGTSGTALEAQEKE
jgi:hypothetical protein